MALDRIDMKILTLLQSEGRVTNRDLAERVGLSASACLERVRRLEHSGGIAGYRAILNTAALFRSVTVIATVTLRSHRREDFRGFEQLVRGMPEVVDCSKVSGEFDYILRMVCPDMATYHALSDRLLEDGADVAHLSSHVVLEETKPFEGFPLEALA